MAKSRDLFDDTTMSFGDHLEVLRIHLWKAIIGLVICVIGSLFFGNHVIAVVRGPIDDALERYGIQSDELDDVREVDFWEEMKRMFSGGGSPESIPEDSAAGTAVEVDANTITVQLSAKELASALHRLHPESIPAPPAAGYDPDAIEIAISAPEFAQLREIRERVDRPVTLNVQEAFMTYLKVSLVSGFVFASPWIFFQVWLFVAAGLYPHERKYVYIYLPLSLTLFLAGAAFCFYLVFPFVLDFLLSFNRMLGVTPQIRLSEWISFAIMLPVMFGLSFQLPLVMLFLERISVFDVESYKSSWRMAVLVIAFISMIMTPADPMSMLLMMFPLIALYGMGIWLCQMRPTKKSPFE